MVRKSILAAALLFTSSAMADDTAETVTSDVPQEAVDSSRVRWGVNAAFGSFLSAGAVDFGVSARVGMQLNSLLAIYGDFGYIAGIGFGASGAGASVSGVGMWHVGPTAEATFGKFFAAGGLMVAGGGWASVSASTAGSGQAIAAGGIMPGMNLRTGFTFGSPQPSGRRSGFTLAVDLKILNAGVTSASAGAGGATVAAGDRIWGVTPMLVLGYDAK
jgi:hypothetical protein